MSIRQSLQSQSVQKHNPFIYTINIKGRTAVGRAAYIPKAMQKAHSEQLLENQKKSKKYIPGYWYQYEISLY